MRRDHVHVRECECLRVCLSVCVFVSACMHACVCNVRAACVSVLFHVRTMVWVWVRECASVDRLVWCKAWAFATNFVHASDAVLEKK